MQDSRRLEIVNIKVTVNTNHASFSDFCLLLSAIIVFIYLFISRNFDLGWALTQLAF
jgi:hypothetical protein